MKSTHILVRFPALELLLYAHMDDNPNVESPDYLRFVKREILYNSTLSWIMQMKKKRYSIFILPYSPDTNPSACINLLKKRLQFVCSKLGIRTVNEKIPHPYCHIQEPFPKENVFARIKVTDGRIELS